MNNEVPIIGVGATVVGVAVSKGIGVGTVVGFGTAVGIAEGSGGKVGTRVRVGDAGVAVDNGAQAAPNKIKPAIVIAKTTRLDILFSWKTHDNRRKRVNTTQLGGAALSHN